MEKELSVFRIESINRDDEELHSACVCAESLENAIIIYKTKHNNDTLLNIEMVNDFSEKVYV